MNNNPNDERPGVAVGHVGLKVNDVAEAKQFFVRHGMREILAQDNFAVLELRGGTHLVLRSLDDGESSQDKCNFDLMVDDIDYAHEQFVEDDRQVLGISRGNIHDSFTVDGPSGIEIQVNSSHAGDRVV